MFAYIFLDYVPNEGSKCVYKHDSKWETHNGTMTTEALHRKEES